MDHQCRNYVNCGEFVDSRNEFCASCKEERNEFSPVEQERTLSIAYLTGSAFDCSREHLLNELAVRAEHFFKQTDGTYKIPKTGGQVEQLIEMAIAAQLKPSSNCAK